MIKVELLKNHPDCVPRLSEIWYEVLGKTWVPDIPIERVIERFKEHLNENTLPLTFVALEQDKPVGMCSLRVTEGIQPDLTPWLGSLVVDPAYQKNGIGKSLMEATKQKAKKLGYKNLYLFTFNPTLPEYYKRLGWKLRGMDKFEDHPVTVMEIGIEQPLKWNLDMLKSLLFKVLL